MKNNNKKEKTTNLEDILSIINDDIDGVDMFHIEQHTEERLNGLETIEKFEDYEYFHAKLNYYDEKYKNNPTELSKRIIVKLKKLIRLFKFSIELERLGNRNTKLKVSIVDDSLIELLRLEKITSSELFSRCNETKNLLKVIDEITRDELENKVINHLTELTREYMISNDSGFKSFDDAIFEFEDLGGN